MWILVRLGIAAIGFAVRVSAGLWPPRQDSEIDGVPAYVRKSTHKGRVRRLDLGIALAGPVVFRLTREGFADRFFKRIGACDEIQTGDSSFDPHVFIACDHPFLADLLGESQRARQAILRIFEAGFERVWTDGRILWIRTRDGREPAEDLWKLLSGLRASIVAIETDLPRRYEDRFLWKALFVEGLTWSIAGYAIAGFVETASQRQDYHVDPYGVLFPGLLMGFLLFSALLLLIRSVLKRSSRGHRILVESVLLLALSLPVAGIQLVSDLNRGLDRAPSSVESRTIARAERREHRGKRGRRYYTYHLYLVPNGRPPDEVETTRQLFERAGPDKDLVMELGPGWLGLPWYRDLTVR